MKRPIIFLFIFLLAFTVVGLFQVNHKVQNLKKDLAEVHRQLATDKSIIHILRAEWAYLNEPTRVKDLSDRYLSLEYTKVAQLKGGSEVKKVYLAKAGGDGIQSRVPVLKPILSSYSR